MFKKYDVIIIGAGPAGAMAAIEAAKNGLRTAILEKAALPRRKVCAGGLAKRAVQLIPSDIQFPVEQQCHAVEMQVSDANMKFRQECENLISMVCRSAFDYALVEYAASLGAEIMDQVTISAVLPHENNVEIKSDHGKFYCSYLVFAEGATARLSNRFWKDERELLPAIEADVYIPTDQFSIFKNQASFDFGAIHSGYVWVFPKNDHLSIGVGTVGNQKVNLQHKLDQYMRRLGILEGAEIVNRKGFIVPVSLRKEPFMKQRMLLVGDTAGFVDPIGGEGLTHAIRSGQEAGRAVARGFDNSAQVNSLYHKAIAEPILKELRIAKKISKFIYTPNPKWRNLFFKRYGERLCRAMSQLLEGKRTYAESLESSKTLMKISKLTGS